MKKTMKMIDLFLKIANGEEVPKKIKYKEWIFIYVDEFYGYMREDYLEVERDISLLCYIVSYEEFNDEVEILDEEEFEDIEEVTQEYGNNGEVTRIFNQLIRNQKKIIERLKESE